MCIKKVSMIVSKNLMENSGCGIPGGFIFIVFILPLFKFFFLIGFVSWVQLKIKGEGKNDYVLKK